MNSTVYLFGNFGQGITLYPNDYTKYIFKEFTSRANAPTQLIIHRDRSIMNYGYIRKIENGHLLGICIQINGQYLIGIKRLFEIFEDIIANIVVRGDIIKLNKQGNLVKNVSKLTDKPKEVEKIISFCQNELMGMSAYCQTLPPINFSTSDSDINNFKETDNNQTIVSASVKNGYTFIYKVDDYDSLFLGEYRSTLYSLNKENEENKQKIVELDKSLSVLKRQKKQMNVVICLVLLLFIGSIIFLNTLDEKNKNIQDQQITIEKQSTENHKLAAENKDIYDKQVSLQDLHHSLVREYDILNEKYDSLEYKYDSLKYKYNKLFSDYNLLQATVNDKQRKIEEIQSKNNSIEVRYNNLIKITSKNDNDYLSLKRNYNKLYNNYNILAKKYYSTKEGKKEIKQYSR